MRCPAAPTYHPGDCGDFETADRAQDLQWIAAGLIDPQRPRHGGDLSDELSLSMPVPGP